MRKMFFAAILAIVTFTNLETPALTIDEDTLAAVFFQVYLERNAESPSPAVLAAKYRMYNMLCFELRDIDCGATPAPKVLTFKTNPFRPGLQGYYDGGDTIFIRNNLRGKHREEVLAHEMSHYLDAEILGMEIPGKALPICFSEKRAWAVSDAYWTKYNHPRKVVGSKWTKWYKHCTPFKDTLYPEDGNEI